jgi:hypothetical protein
MIQVLEWPAEFLHRMQSTDILAARSSDDEDDEEDDDRDKKEQEDDEDEYDGYSE